MLILILKLQLKPFKGELCCFKVSMRKEIIGGASYKVEIMSTCAPRLIYATFNIGQRFFVMPTNWLLQKWINGRGKLAALNLARYWTPLEWCKQPRTKLLRIGTSCSGSLNASNTQTCRFSVGNGLFLVSSKYIHVQRSRSRHLESKIGTSLNWSSYQFIHSSLIPRLAALWKCESADTITAALASTTTTTVINTTSNPADDIQDEDDIAVQQFCRAHDLKTWASRQHGAGCDC